MARRWAPLDPQSSEHIVGRHEPRIVVREFKWPANLCPWIPCPRMTNMPIRRLLVVASGCQSPGAGWAVAAWPTDGRFDHVRRTSMGELKGRSPNNLGPLRTPCAQCSPERSRWQAGAPAREQRSRRPPRGNSDPFWPGRAGWGGNCFGRALRAGTLKPAQTARPPHAVRFRGSGSPRRARPPWSPQLGSRPRLPQLVG